MLEDIGTVENIPDFLEEVKNGRAVLVGFGRGVYKTFDPRAMIAKDIADKVLEITGKEPLLEIALELEN